MSAPRIDFRYAPPRRWTCIGRPDDPHKTLVTEDGALLYDFERDPGRIEHYRFGRVVAFRPLGDRHLRDVTQFTEDARTPITVTRLDYGSLRLEMRAVGHISPAGGRVDLVRWRIDVDATARQSALTGIWLEAQAVATRFTTASKAPGHRVFAQSPERAPQPEGLPAMFEVRAVDDTSPEGARLFLVSDRPLEMVSAFDYGPASGLAMEPTLVPPGGALEGAFALPLDDAAAAEVTADPWSLERCDAMLEQERSFWHGYAPLDVPMTVPDDDLHSMIVASARNVLQAREVVDGLPVFQVGPTIYRGLWIVDGYFFLEAARYLGLEQDADHGIEVLLRRAAPNGAIEEMPFHHKETGIAIATIVRQLELAGDRQRLQDLWPTLLAAVGHVEHLMDEADRLPPDAPEHGIFPASFPDGGIGGMRPEYTTALWSLVGLAAAIRGARWLEHERDEARIERLYLRLFEATERGRRRDQLVTEDGVRYWPQTMPGSGQHVWVPNYPGEAPPHRRIAPGSGNWALAQAITPGEVYPADHEVVRDLCELFAATDAHEGVPAGTGWLPFRASWNYATAFYAQVWLYAERPDKAVDYLYAMANHASPTRTWREEQSFADSGDALVFGDMPHNWASVEFIRLVRSMLVFERSESLDLFAGVPSTWWSTGRAFGIVATPTRFGEVTVTAAPCDGGYQLDVKVRKRREQEIEPALRVRVADGAPTVRYHDRVLEPGWNTLG